MRPWSENVARHLVAQSAGLERGSCGQILDAIGEAHGRGGSRPGLATQPCGLRNVPSPTVQGGDQPAY